MEIGNMVNMNKERCVKKKREILSKKRKKN